MFKINLLKLHKQSYIFQLIFQNCIIFDVQNKIMSKLQVFDYNMYEKNKNCV